MGNAFISKAEVGFEPTNNGFAIRPLSPLGYSAELLEHYPRLPILASQALLDCNSVSQRRIIPSRFRFRATAAR